MNHCKICENRIPDDVSNCEEAGFGEGCGRTLALKDVQVEEKEEFLDLLHRVVQHTPLKIEETSGGDYNKGYIFYQDMVLRDVEELEIEMWNWHQKTLTQTLKAERQKREEMISKMARAVDHVSEEDHEGSVQYYVNSADIYRIAREYGYFTQTNNTN